jgi:hypothetical protein
MEKEFIPYEQALALKELGFNEPCFGYYLDEKLNIFHSTSENDRINSKTIEIFSSNVITSPTFSQAFRWFREKYDLIVCNDYGNNEYFYWLISKDEKMFFNNEDEEGNVTTYKTYEEAELECLKKLIEMVKEK